jgi:hypothetical protein
MTDENGIQRIEVEPEIEDSPNAYNAITAAQGKT